MKFLESEQTLSTIADEAERMLVNTPNPHWCEAYRQIASGCIALAALIRSSRIELEPPNSNQP